MAEVDKQSPRLQPLDVAKQNDYGRAVHERIVESGKIVPYRIADDDGHLVGMYRVLAYAPSLGEGIMDLGARWSRDGYLTARMQKIAILATAAKGRAAYVWYAHERAGRDMLTQAERDGLRERRPLNFADPKDQAVHDVARALLDDEGYLDDALYARAVEAIGQEGLIELTWIVGIYAADTLHLRVHRLGLPGGEPEPVW